MGHEFLVHVDVLFIDQFPQCGDFADLFEEIDFVLAVAVDSHSSRIIAAVFKTLESCTCQHTIEAGVGGWGKGVPSSKTLMISPLRFSTR
jgi:hypothetical protein